MDQSNGNNLDDKPKFNVYLKSKLSGVTLLPGFEPDQDQETEKDEGRVLCEIEYFPYFLLYEELKFRFSEF